MIQRAQFIQAVEALVGTPVVHMGRVAGEGVDCVGVPLVALAQCGSTVHGVHSYPRLPDQEQLGAGLRLYCDQIDRQDVQPGDLLQVFAGRQARHVMVVVAMNESGQFVVVHAWAKGRVVRRTSIGPETKIAAVWRIREVQDG